MKIQIHKESSTTWGTQKLSSPSCAHSALQCQLLLAHSTSRAEQLVTQAIHIITKSKTLTVGLFTEKQSVNPSRRINKTSSELYRAGEDRHTAGRVWGKSCTAGAVWGLRVLSSPVAWASHTGAAFFSFSISDLAPGLWPGREGWPKFLSPCKIRETRRKLLVSDWLSAGHCGCLGNETANGKSLSLSLLLPTNLSFT